MSLISFANPFGVHSMLFNSPIFLFAFFPVVYFVYWHLRGKNLRYAWLVATGYIFYGYWRPAFCLVMAFSTAVSYLAGRGFLVAKARRTRRLLLILPITIDLSLLGFFKYADFALGTINGLVLERDKALPLLHIVLPIGISFYTFHTISYIVDAYRGAITPTRNFLEFATYVSLFSQLIAGPIVRFRELQEDLEHIDQSRRPALADAGWSFFAIGMIQKVLLADPIATHIDPALKTVGALSTSASWLCAIGYSYQLLLDFAGYSNMAIGLGLLFGMHIPQNFDKPYQALSPADFWRRWHMSLSRFLRDYLYIPLGGSRGAASATDRNLMITMILGGLWHGANWTFVAWGAYHALLLVGYRRFRDAWDALPVLLRRGATFLLVLVGWCLFRSPTFNEAGTFLHHLFVPVSGTQVAGASALCALLLVAAVITHAGPSSFELSHTWRPWQAVALTLLFVVAVLRVLGASSSPFLYFQF